MRLEPFFQDDGDGFLRFRRVIVRDAAYGGLPYGTRRRLHAAVGLRMEREYGDTLDEMGGLLSLHFHRAGEHEKTWRYAREAADRARGERGVRSRGRPLPPRARRRARASTSRPADAGGRVGGPRRGAGARRRGEARRSSRSAARGGCCPRIACSGARLMHRTAWVHERVGHTAAAIRWGRPRAARARGRRRSRRRARARRARRRRSRRCAGSRAARPRPSACAASRSPRRRSPDDELLARARLVQPRLGARRPRARARGHALGAGARDLHARRGHRAAGRRAEQPRHVRLLGGPLAGGVDLYARAAEASARAGDVWAAAYGDCNIGEVLADQGRLEEAEERLRRARRVWHGTEDEHGVAFTSALLGRLAARARPPRRRGRAADRRARAASTSCRRRVTPRSPRPISPRPRCSPGTAERGARARPTASSHWATPRARCCCACAAARCASSARTRRP